MSDRSSHGYALKYQPDEQGELLTDDRSIAFADHVLEHGPQRHRRHRAVGQRKTTGTTYDVVCSCGQLVRVPFRIVANEEASL